jgi:hypothetical protein
MKIDTQVRCYNFPCMDITPDLHQMPSLDLDPQSIRMLVISESVPVNPGNDYYSSGKSSYARTTLSAFRAAGVKAASMQDLLNQGIYFTNAVKCPKTSFSIQVDTIKECSRLLEKEVALFPNLKVILLMGEVAVKAFNSISIRVHQQRVIPDGPTYQIRAWKFAFNGIRVMPSYSQVGTIDKSKHGTIVEDITKAMQLMLAEE